MKEQRMAYYKGFFECFKIIFILGVGYWAGYNNITASNISVASLKGGASNQYEIEEMQGLTNDEVVSMQSLGAVGY